jgi:hypothetical protein
LDAALAQHFDSLVYRASNEKYQPSQQKQSLEELARNLDSLKPDQQKAVLSHLVLTASTNRYYANVLDKLVADNPKVQEKIDALKLDATTARLSGPTPGTTPSYVARRGPLNSLRMATLSPAASDESTALASAGPAPIAGKNNAAKEALLQGPFTTRPSPMRG